MKYFDYLRIFFYFLLTAIIFLISFSPFGFLFYWFIHSEIDNLMVYLLGPLFLVICYYCTCFLFAFLHGSMVLILLPKLKAGSYPHKDSFTKVIAVRLTADSVLKSMLKVTSWIPFINHRYVFLNLLRVYGLKVGRGNHIASQTYVDCNNLVEIGNCCFIGYGSVITSHMNENNNLILYKTKIGSHSTIGTRAIIAPGSIIGDNVIIGAQALTLPNREYDSNALYSGIPAKKIRDLEVIIPLK